MGSRNISIGWRAGFSGGGANNIKVVHMLAMPIRLGQKIFFLGMKQAILILAGN